MDADILREVYTMHESIKKAVAPILFEFDKRFGVYPVEIRLEGYRFGMGEEKGIAVRIDAPITIPDLRRK